MPNYGSEQYGASSQNMENSYKNYQSKTRLNNINNDFEPSNLNYNQKNNNQSQSKIRFNDNINDSGNYKDSLDLYNANYNQKNENQNHFQKTGNSILQSNNLNANQDIFEQADNFKAPEQDVPNQYNTGNNFQDKANQEFDYQQSDPDQLIAENLDYLYHESDHDMNRQANRYYNSSEDSLKPIMGLVEDPGMTEELMRLRKYQKNQAQARALLDQIEEKKQKKEWEKNQKKIEENREYLQMLEEKENFHENGNMQSVINKEAYEMLHSKGLDKKNVRFESKSENQLEELQKQVVRQSIEDLSKKFKVEVDSLKDSMYEKNTQIISEMQKLKDKTYKFTIEKDQLNADMGLIHRNLMEQQSENDDNLRYLYMAQSKTNPTENIDKKQKSEYQKYVP